MSSAAAVNSPRPLHEHRGIAISATLVKRGRKTLTDANVALPIQKRQPRDPIEDYVPYPIMEETPGFHAGDATSYMPHHHLWFPL